ncbi:SAM-dependent methyltransferase [Nocardia terpenica]|uniref:SAM-dependent methyltransferase n=1 Tax=Nocardia terpenica TaxID=455432 RepID=A0A6G9ZDK0_9NOCA|nr:SAM-dependent methyltransferase [Nocardia terpenica]QIS23471.1 hypothetical protein F6W96_39375 [Nocardia terpenica]
MTNRDKTRKVNTTTPSAARQYHLRLAGGEAVPDADRDLARRFDELFPHADTCVLHLRAFLIRAVRFMTDNGIRQFLDIGSGLPTGNTHDIARDRIPDARVVYVDNDPETVDHSRDLLLRQKALTSTAIIAGDLRNPDDIFAHPAARRLINFDEPLGVLLVSVLPFVPDSVRPRKLLARLYDFLPSGSYIAMTHGSPDDADPQIQQQLAAATTLYGQTFTPVTLRSRAQFAHLFSGFELVDPGITYAPDWHPDTTVDTTDPTRPCILAAIGYKP